MEQHMEALAAAVEPLRFSSHISTLSDATGIGGPALRLLLCLFLGYPLSLIYRLFLIRLEVPSVKHLYFALCGLWMAIFCYGADFVHSFLNILIGYLVLLIIPNRTISLILVFLGALAHLLIGYALISTDSYDIDYTTAQSVLCLRMIGFAWDVFDGGRAESVLEHDQKENRIQTLPNLLAVYGYFYFPGGFLIGPQFTYKLYSRFISNEIFRNPVSKKIELPSPFGAAFISLVLGALYLAIHNVVAMFYPTSIMKSDLFLHQMPFWERLITMWLACKVALMKYLGVWLLGEGVCILAGIGFAGYNKDGKSEGWHRLANVKPGQFETSLNLQGIIESFNINTNDWVKRYIFKRLKFLNNRDISLLAALFFLALWHGFAPGYFLCFLLEFVDMSAEKKLQVLLQPLNNAIERSNVLIRYVYYAICWIIRTFALHYGLISFEVKSWKASLAAYGALYYIGHIAVLLVFIAHMLFAPKRKRTPTNTTPSTATAAADTKKKV